LGKVPKEPFVSDKENEAEIINPQPILIAEE
jgi:hypothetical protein